MKDLVLSRQDSTIFRAWAANPSAGFKRKKTPPHCFVHYIGANFVVLYSQNYMARHYHKTCLVCLAYQQTPHLIQATLLPPSSPPPQRKKVLLNFVIQTIWVTEMQGLGSLGHLQLSNDDKEHLLEERL